jgi:uncharacterized protein
VIFDFWYMLPVSIGVATVAMASGVEGATFFAPIFLLAIGLPADIAIGTGLVTEVFGFASGVTAYVRRRYVDYRLARSLLTATIPAAVAGSLVAGYVRAEILETVLGMGLIAVALSFLRAPDGDETERLDRGVAEDFGKSGRTCLVTAEGEEIRYTVCNRVEGSLVAGLGALFMGMISTGLGELNGYFLLRRCRVPSRIAVGTGVVVVAVTALSAATVHVWRFVATGGDALPTVVSLAAFTVPGVIVGGQLGPMVASRISQHVLEKGLGILFLLVGGLMLWRVAG